MKKRIINVFSSLCFGFHPEIHIRKTRKNLFLSPFKLLVPQKKEENSSHGKREKADASKTVI
jgi:hypothetical protein